MEHDGGRDRRPGIQHGDGVGVARTVDGQLSERSDFQTQQDGPAHQTQDEIGIFHQQFVTAATFQQVNRKRGNGTGDRGGGTAAIIPGSVVHCAVGNAHRNRAWRRRGHRQRVRAGVDCDERSGITVRDADIAARKADDVLGELEREDDREVVS